MTAAATPRIIGYMRGKVLALKQPGINPAELRTIAGSMFHRGIFLQEDRPKFLEAFMQGYRNTR